jgi:pseudaminic acid synthase
MTMPGVFRIEDENSLWNGRELYELYKEAYTPWEWHKQIFEHAQKLGLMAFSTPFDESAVDFLEDLGVQAYKIASFENTDLPLIKKVASKNKPVIISTGAANISDIDLAVNTLRSNGCNEIILLKCTSTYPSTPENTNILTIPHMSQLFNCQVGLSDHTMGIGVSVAAIALGARVIEKHFTLSRKDGGVDSAFSIEPHELKNLVEETERAFLGLGKIQYGVQSSEKNSLNFKRSIFASKNINIGELLTLENTRVIRPGIGLAPKYYDMILGKNAKLEIKSGQPILWEMI